MIAAEALKTCLDTASAYPFSCPDEDFLFWRGRAHPVAADLPPDLRRILGEEPRSALIAYGSNRSPQRLAQKYGEDQALLARRAWIDGFDIGFAGHFAHYGSIPAGIFPASTTRALVTILFLTEAQLASMHATEALGRHYLFGRLAAEIRFVGGGSLDEAGVYWPMRGCVAPDGFPVALAAISAQGRGGRASGQREMLEWAAERAGMPVAEFVWRLTQDELWRHSMTDRLRETVCRAEACAAFRPKP